MVFHEGGFRPEVLEENVQELSYNAYPGRGIVLGKSADGFRAVQVYWVMGRSPNSRNRHLVADERQNVRTEIYEDTGDIDPSLIVYDAMRCFRAPQDKVDVHMVSNGDQTSDLMRAVMRTPKIRGDGAVNEAFATALIGREFEPDAPNYTPRISGLLAVYGSGARVTYNWSIIRRGFDTGNPEHTFGRGNLAEIPPGAGLCFHTYDGNGDPLPSFEGSPYPIPLEAKPDEIAEALWERLDYDNKVGLVVKAINLGNGAVDLSIQNKLAA